MAPKKVFGIHYPDHSNACKNAKGIIVYPLALYIMSYYL